MMINADGVPALPLWINGHAYLTCVKDFYTLHDARSQAALRRVPLCGMDEVAEAVQVATQALQSPQPASVTVQALHDMADTLAEPRFARHFAALLAEEAGFSDVAAEAEVAAAVTALRAASAPVSPAAAIPVSGGQVWALLTDASQPLAAVARWLAESLPQGQGQALILKPSPKAPSCALALSELASRAGIADGRVNLVQGDDAALDALAAHPGIACLHLAGQADWQVRVQAVAQRHGKTCQIVNQT